LHDLAGALEGTRIVRRVMVVYGTRPEAIKMAPIVAALRDSPVIDPVIVVTGQHREMLDHVHHVFDVRPDHDLAILTPLQTLTDVTQRVLAGVNALVRRATRRRPSPPRLPRSTNRFPSSMSRRACVRMTGTHRSPRRSTGGSRRSWPASTSRRRRPTAPNWSPPASTTGPSP
jgi:hypothetical protein